MFRDEIIENLPPLHQKLAILVLGVVSAYWLIRMVRQNQLHERHALLWFLGIGLGVVTVWCDPLLAGITQAIGTDVPASTLMLLAVFFLFLTCVWLTSQLSLQQRRLAKLVMEISVLKSAMRDQETSTGESHS